jgi:predicted TPR repeat methyltransferase
MAVHHLNQAYALSKTDIGTMKALYDKWAATYDSDLAEADQDYVGPAIAAQYVLKTLNTPSIADTLEILDAGCGTGLVGAHLGRLGARKIDGVDLSPGMLDVARATGAYRDLTPVDLSKRLPNGDDSYDLLVCVGTLTQGHVGPEALVEFTRVVKKSGFVIATVLEEIWQPQGYEAEVKDLAAQGKVKVVSSQLEDYRRGAGVQARMVVLEVL